MLCALNNCTIAHQNGVHITLTPYNTPNLVSTLSREPPSSEQYILDAVFAFVGEGKSVEHT